MFYLFVGFLPRAAHMLFHHAESPTKHAAFFSPAQEQTCHTPILSSPLEALSRVTGSSVMSLSCAFFFFNSVSFWVSFAELLYVFLLTDLSSFSAFLLFFCFPALILFSRPFSSLLSFFLQLTLSLQKLFTSCLCFPTLSSHPTSVRST